MRDQEPTYLGPVPLLDPLSYPGRPLEHAALLDGERLVPVGGAVEFGDLLAVRGVVGMAGRTPVVAVGSNGAPAQVRYKFGRGRVSGVVPMVPTVVRGVGVGVSAHVCQAGYVPAAPVFEGDGAATLVVCWLDPEQLAVMDASEGGNYRRVPAPGGEGELYVSSRGVLVDGDGVPRRAEHGQRGLIRSLLGESAALRRLFGDGPESWVRVASADAGARERAAWVFFEEGWVRESGRHGLH